MGVITLPANIEQDRQNNVKASSVHVQGNFDALLNAVNRKLEIDGSIVPTADLPMGSHKITQLGSPTTSADATTKGYVDSALLLKANLASPAFTGTPTAPTVSSVTDNSGKIATTKFIIDVLKAIYPVGSVYIGTQNTCPMGAFFGTWTLVATNRALWGGNGTNGNTTINAGLPDVTGRFGFIGPDVTSTSYFNHASGAFTGAYGTSGANGFATGNIYAGGWGPNNIEFKASRSSSIYGNSSTVQPPAYVVNVWRRTA